MPRSALRSQTSQRPTVALVAHDIHRNGGMEQAMFELVLRAHDRVDFVVVSATLADELQPLVRWRRVPVMARPFPLKFSLFFIIAGMRYRRQKVDLVHTLGAIMPRRADIVGVHFCHVAFSESGPTRDATATSAATLSGTAIARRAKQVNRAIAFFLGEGAERWYLGAPRATVATAVSDGLAIELERWYPRLPVTVITNGVDQARFRADAAVRQSVRADCRVGTDEVIALFVGGRWEHKGLSLAIEALAAVVSRVPVPVTLWVLGRGDVMAYQALAEKYGIGDRVRFLGFATDPEHYFQAADVFLLLSTYESFSLVVHEAAAAALPIIATAVSGVNELLTDGEAGVLVARQPAAVAVALERLISDPGLRQRMGEAAQARSGSFSWQDNADRTVALYHQLLNGDM